VVNGNDAYDWKNALTSYFQDYDGISKFQHFAVDSDEPGTIRAKSGFEDDRWEKKKLLKSEKNIRLKKSENLPKHLSVVGFEGGKLNKEKNSYKNLRPYVKDEWKDSLCPDPETFKLPVRQKKICPDWLQCSNLQVRPPSLI